MSNVRSGSFQNIDDEGWSWTQVFAFDDVCLMCGEKLTVPFVFWHGVGKELSLHPKCAALLGGALMRDYLEMIQGKTEADEWWWQKMKPTIKDA
jgi:hypothetical protein